MITITFWGVRGTVPVPGSSTVRTGGNTPCVEVGTGEPQTLILDAGTGIRVLGLNLVQRASPPLDILLLLSHTHWDHIQGLPLFAPAREPRNRIRVLGDDTRTKHRFGLKDQPARSLAGRLAIQMSPCFFPLSQEELAAGLQFGDLPADGPLPFGASTTIEARRLRHPNGVLGFRICSGDQALVYASDVSHPEDGLDPDVVALARGADLLIHDAHFVPEERAGHNDWGHSSWLEACQVAEAAGVARLALFHHAPTRTDDEVDAIEAAAREVFPGAFAAREGAVVQL
jgi:phosphoribosyl 1,2-cyclic phosphodiesterase